MAFAPVFQRPFSGTFDRHAAAAAIIPWWLVGGAPAPVAVYQPKGAASLVASYSNLVSPGTYDAVPGVAPTWSSATGWTGNGLSMYLATGITPADGWAVIVRFSGAPTSSGRLLGSIGSSKRFGVIPDNSGAVTYEAETINQTSPGLAAGVLGFADRQGYRNGVADGAAGSAGTGTYAPIYLLCRNSSGPANYTSASIQAIVIWNTSTDHATWMPAVMAAVALI